MRGAELKIPSDFKTYYRRAQWYTALTSALRRQKQVDLYVSSTQQIPVQPGLLLHTETLPQKSNKKVITQIPNSYELYYKFVLQSLIIQSVVHECRQTYEPEEQKSMETNWSIIYGHMINKAAILLSRKGPLCTTNAGKTG